MIQSTAILKGVSKISWSRDVAVDVTIILRGSVTCLYHLVFSSTIQSTSILKRVSKISWSHHVAINESLSEE
jgi:hypothetical protein